MLALSKRVPLLYAIIMISVVGLAFTHVPHAPAWMTIGIPCLFGAVSIIRLFHYWHVGHAPSEDADVSAQIVTAGQMSFALSIAFVSWALALTRYGTADTQSQVVFFVGITSFGNAATVMHVRAALVAMLAGTLIPLLAYLALSANVVFMVMAINLLGVALAIATVLLHSSRDFDKLVTFSVELEHERSEAQRLSRVNFNLANVDALTGLSNRRGFFRTLESLIADQHETGAFAVGVLDLDGFKPINDIYGHPAGDKVLREVGGRLLALGERVTVARLGGDEFGLIVTGFSGRNDLLAYASSICEMMRVPFVMDRFSAQMSASLGMAICSSASGSAEELFRHSDYALYHAKHHANGSAVLFSDDHAEQIRESTGVERRLRDADLRKEIQLVYQVIYDSRHDAMIGVEALARWHNPMIGTVPPDVFIRAAERSGMIGQLTEVLFRKLLSEFDEWPEDVFLSFNLSAHDICVPERILKLISIAGKAGVDPKRLTFEITETALMNDFDRALESLQLLKRFGARIALDDFGTGHSSLSYVHALPLDRVKIDRSFVGQIETNPVSRAVVQTILDLCENLGLDCIVEGVETDGQLQLMQTMGCSTFQGYLFSRPMTGNEARRLINAANGRRQLA